MTPLVLITGVVAFVPGSFVALSLITTHFIADST